LVYLAAGRRFWLGGTVLIISWIVYVSFAAELRGIAGFLLLGGAEAFWAYCVVRLGKLGKMAAGNCIFLALACPPSAFLVFNQANIELGKLYGMRFTYLGLVVLPIEGRQPDGKR
jgi:hypothetical protein